MNGNWSVSLNKLLKLIHVNEKEEAGRKCFWSKHQDMVTEEISIKMRMM